MYVTALVYHWLDEFLISACHAGFVLQERRVREMDRKMEKAKRTEERVRTTREKLEREVDISQKG